MDGSKTEPEGPLLSRVVNHCGDNNKGCAPRVYVFITLLATELGLLWYPYAVSCAWPLATLGSVTLNALYHYYYS